jgi:hypothetical protein
MYVIINNFPIEPGVKPNDILEYDSYLCLPWSVYCTLIELDRCFISVEY